MNNMALKAKIKNVSIKKNIDFNIALRIYMYDRFIERLSISKYKDNFILKGGFYLSTLFGLENRTTMDIDTIVENVDFNFEKVQNIIEEIIQIDINDNAHLELDRASSIRMENKYGGFRFVINVKIGRIKDSFQLDIATGDPITPSAIIYHYFPFLSEKPIKLWAYNMETVIAEKLETILSRLELSSRLRDYYDIYLIYTTQKDKISNDILREAIHKTLTKRNYRGNISEAYEIIRNSTILESKWNSYSNKYDYAKNISYEQIMSCLKMIIDILEMTLI